MIENVKKYFDSFMPLANNEWQDLRKRLVPHELGKGDFLLKEGEVCNKLFFLTEGLIRKFEKVRNKDITLHFYDEYQFVSVYDSFLQQSPSASYLQALERCSGYSISYGDVQYMYETNPRWERIGRLITEAVYTRELNRVRKLLSYNSTESYELMQEEGAAWVDRVNQKYIASYLGISPESLSRLRKKIENKRTNRIVM